MYSLSNPSNVINVLDYPQVEETEASVKPEDLQLWSALTLGSLQKQLTGHEDDPRFEAARTLIDSIATQFATSNPIEIADYFEAIEALAALNSETQNRLDEVGDFNPLAA